MNNSKKVTPQNQNNQFLIKQSSEIHRSSNPFQNNAFLKQQNQQSSQPVQFIFNKDQSQQNPQQQNLSYNTVNQQPNKKFQFNVNSLSQSDNKNNNQFQFIGLKQNESNYQQQSKSEMEVKTDENQEADKQPQSQIQENKNSIIQKNENNQQAENQDQSQEINDQNKIIIQGDQNEQVQQKEIAEENKNEQSGQTKKQNEDSEQKDENNQTQENILREEDVKTQDDQQNSLEEKYLQNEVCFSDKRKNSGDNEYKTEIVPTQNPISNDQTKNVDVAQDNYKEKITDDSQNQTQQDNNLKEDSNQNQNADRTFQKFDYNQSQNIKPFTPFQNNQNNIFSQQQKEEQKQKSDEQPQTQQNQNFKSNFGVKQNIFQPQFTTQNSQSSFQNVGKQSKIQFDFGKSSGFALQQKKNDEEIKAQAINEKSEEKEIQAKSQNFTANEIKPSNPFSQNLNLNKQNQFGNEIASDKQKFDQGKLNFDVNKKEIPIFVNQPQLKIIKNEEKEILQKENKNEMQYIQQSPIMKNILSQKEAFTYDQGNQTFKQFLGDHFAKQIDLQNRFRNLNQEIRDHELDIQYFNLFIKLLKVKKLKLKLAKEVNSIRENMDNLDNMSTNLLAKLREQRIKLQQQILQKYGIYNFQGENDEFCALISEKGQKFEKIEAINKIFFDLLNTKQEQSDFFRNLSIQNEIIEERQYRKEMDQDNEESEIKKSIKILEEQGVDQETINLVQNVQMIKNQTIPLLIKQMQRTQRMINDLIQ